MGIDDTAAIDCYCGAIYNSFGQRLKPRSMWEEKDDE